ncbi:UNVERIFIED_ORG: hypothetical protein BDU10_9542 [Burkholderia sp. CF145]
MKQTVIAGPAGPIEVLEDWPDEHEIRGVAIITHPHPLLGGTAQHKVPQTIARACQSHGFLTLRPNFRGVGKTAGTHDAGRGETDDVLSIVGQALANRPGLPLILAGFSFGSFVQALVGSRLYDEKGVRAHMILAGVPYGTIPAARTYETPPVPQSSLVIHGECDDVVPLANVFDWVRPQDVPVVVVPGANHFFTGKLPVFRRALDDYLRVRFPPVPEG